MAERLPKLPGTPRVVRSAGYFHGGAPRIASAHPRPCIRGPPRSTRGMDFPVLERILLVEDEVDIQMVARLALEDIGGFQVEVCDSGAAALERGPAFRPQLILLDFMMPVMDGRKTMVAFRDVPELEKVPVVFLTARAQLEEVQEYRSLGAIEVIVKPFDPMRLADRVHAIWKRHHEMAAEDPPEADARAGESSPPDATSLSRDARGEPRGAS